ncbi:MAG: hypothetical protein EPN72_05145 [Nevskiaceae bacterium]|nr:MAG: hypothetical protein EPN63_04050 [Nevskiaceae bacterium]TBR73528.1 MAG: hypothetical protein EPN72_05145 [Nevskiaceae bacterium]
MPSSADATPPPISVHAEARQWRGRLWRNLALPPGFVRRTLIENGAITVLVLAYTAGIYGAAALFGKTDALKLNLYNAFLGVFVGTSLFVGVLGYFFYLLVILHPPSPFAVIHRHLKTHLRFWERAVIGAPMLVVMPLFFSVFTSGKNLIPVFNPYHWDTTFAAWDRWLAGGVEPWQRLAFLLQAPFSAYLVAGINILYDLWMLLMVMALLWQAFTPNRPTLRLQFFLAYLLCWALLGTTMATALSSVGPCFYGHVVVSGPNPYAALMATLHELNTIAPNYALDTQRNLWKTFTDNHLTLGSGISAMPSLHLSIATLMALLAWRTRRWMGVVFIAYLAVLEVGSVLLGWHYLVDGLVAVAGTFLIWALAGWLATATNGGPRRHERDL